MLGSPGESCVDVCGSESAVAEDLIETKASTSAVVLALTAQYGLGPIGMINYDGLDQPCAMDSAYLYVSMAYGWDCYYGETIYRLGDVYRTPCTCTPPPPLEACKAVLIGLIAGAATFAFVLGLGCAYEVLHLRAAERGSHGWPGWKFRMIGGALLQLLNQLAHFYIVYRFYLVELWFYFYASVVIFVLNSLFCAYLGRYDECPWLAVPLGLLGLAVPYEAVQSAVLGLNREYVEVAKAQQRVARRFRDLLRRKKGEGGAQPAQAGGAAAGLGQVVAAATTQAEADTRTEVPDSWEGAAAPAAAPKVQGLALNPKARQPPVELLKESRDFSRVWLSSALLQSAPMLYLLSYVIAYEGFASVMREMPEVAASSLVTYVTLACAITCFVISPATHPAHRIGVDCLQSVPVGLGILLYHLADIAMRTVAFATFVYALSGWAWVALPLGLSAWLAVEQVLVLRGAERDMTLQELENTGRRLLGPSHVGKEHLRDRMTGKQPGGLRWEAVKKPRGDVRNRTLGEKPSAALAEHLRNKAADDQGTLWLLEAEWRGSGVRSLR